jgi:tetratricopeptide (TPR) repeat protein
MTGAPEDDRRTRRSPRGFGLLRWLLGARDPAEPDAELPRRIGRYRVVRQLGEGGMGRVLLAQDEALRREVAVKVLKRTDRSSRRRFLREARTAARVSHPNVCPIFEVGEESGRPFLAMELLAGETLSSRLRRGALPPEEALDLAADVLAALGALHDAGIVHRDVKPSNVFLTPHGGRLVDFGLARALPREVVRSLAPSTGQSTRSGLIVGTPGYMAPEQILGHPVDARCDLFAAGAVLYEALSGRRPFEGDSAATMLSGTLYETPPPLAGSAALEALDAPLRRALAKKAADRFTSAGEMTAALRAAAVAGRPGALAARRDAFVGREHELAWLEERFAAAVAGSGSVALVTGERGAGKTALVSEFLRRLRAGDTPLTVAAGRCVEAQGPTEPFLPFHDAVGRLLGGRAHDMASELLRKYAPTIALQMPAGLLPDPDGSLRRQTAGATKDRLIREAGDFMDAASRTFPIVLFVEDLHWADPASVDLLHHEGCRIGRQRTLLLASLRHADADASNPHLKRCLLDLLARGAAHELAVGPLREEDVAAYLETRFPGHAFPPGLAGALYARTEGLALFVRSLTDVLVERRDIARDASGWRLARPVAELDLEPTKGLRDLVRQQLDGLADGERQILEAASVCGREFLSPVVAHLAGREERHVEEDLRRLGRVRRLIAETGEEALPDGTVATRYRFAHGLYESVLREDLVASRRVALHRAAAERLVHHWAAEAPRIAAEVAGHYERARDHERAVAFRGHAGDNAARRFAYAEAAEHYDWAFRSLESLPAEARPKAAMGLYRRRGTVRLAQARFDDAAADFEAMLVVARGTDAAVAERAALAGLCDALFFAQRVDEMAARARELLEAATEPGAGEADAAEARARMGQVLLGQGRFADAIPLLDEAVRSARRARATVALKIGLSCRGLVHYWQTEYRASEIASVEAASLAAALGDGFAALGSGMFRGLSRAYQGRVSEALDDFADAIAVARRNGDRYWLPRLVSHLGWVHRELGALERARAHDTEALRIAREGPVWGPESEVLLNLCVDDVREGRPEQAAALLAELESRAASSTWMRWLSELRLAAAATEHWAACGDRERTFRHAAHLAEASDRLGARDYRCAAARLRTSTVLELGGDLAEVACDLATSLDRLRATPAPLETWKSARLLALARKRLGDAEGAREAYEEAARAIRVIAAGTRDEGLREGFLATAAVREVLEAVAGGPRVG